MAISIGAHGAAQIATKWASGAAEVSGGNARELRLGWYFPVPFDGRAPGCNGIIVNKADGSVFALGSAFPVERDLRLYDRGFQSGKVDLVVLEVVDWPGTVDALLEVGPRKIELSYESGTVWRLPRLLTEDAVLTRPTGLHRLAVDSIKATAPAGWLVRLPPLEAGGHVLTFSGSGDDVELAVQYDLVVAP